MTLSDFATFSTALSGLAVTASLIYLAIQTHQGAKHTKALIQQGRVGRMIASLIGWSEAERCASWIEANGGTPTPQAIRQRQFLFQCGAIVAAMEDLYAQHNDGLLDQEQFEAQSVTFALALSETGLKSYWTQWKADRPKQALKFQRFVDGLAARGAEAISPNEATRVQLD